MHSNVQYINEEHQHAYKRNLPFVHIDEEYVMVKMRHRLSYTQFY